MKLKAFHLVYLVVLLLCFDSLFKVSIGPVHVQAGILLGLISIAILKIDLLLKNKKIKNKIDLPITLIIIYSLFHFQYAKDTKVYISILSYLIIFALMYSLVRTSYSKVNWKSIAKFSLIILIATGFFQYALINYFGIQLSLRDIDETYYQDKGNLGLRMRGFFLEPNWFGLVLFSWSFIYFSKIERMSSNNILLAVLVAACLYLSENRLILVLSVILITSHFFIPPKSLYSKYIPFTMVAAACAIFLFISVGNLDIQDRSAMARTYTAGNTLSAWLNFSTPEKILGKGFSNWGFYSNLLEISWSNYKFDQPLTRRDNAESYVFLFEMGIISIIIFSLDLLIIGRKSISPEKSIYISCIYISALFYPIYTFIMYLIPLMIVRHEIYSGENANNPPN